MQIGSDKVVASAGSGEGIVIAGIGEGVASAGIGEGVASALFEQIHPSIGTILCAECWCCLSNLLGYWAQSWTGRHSDTVYQQAGTDFANLGRMTGTVNPTWY